MYTTFIEIMFVAIFLHTKNIWLVIFLHTAFNFVDEIINIVVDGKELAIQSAQRSSTLSEIINVLAMAVFVALGFMILKKLKPESIVLNREIDKDKTQCS